MSAAQVYLQSNIFDRLSRTRGGKLAGKGGAAVPVVADHSALDDEPYFDDEAKDAVLDMSSFLRSAAGTRVR